MVRVRRPYLLTLSYCARRMIRDDDRTDLHIFSSHFYTTLLEEGPESVAKWTKRKNIDVFARKFIYIPSKCWLFRRLSRCADHLTLACSTLILQSTKAYIGRYALW